MGMTAAFVAVSPEELASLQADPSTVGSLFFDRLGARASGHALDIDKSWAGLHFLLTGEQYGGQPPHSLPILGGTEFGPELSYGPARFLVPSEVSAAAAALNETSIDSLRQRFVPSALEEAEIYPSGIWESEGMDGFAYLEHWYGLLQEFYAQAAARGDAMLLAII